MTRIAAINGIQTAIEEARYLINNVDWDEALSQALEPVLELLEQAEELTAEVIDHIDDLPSEFDE